jgi:8-hydroxy-5-deazaflavin:NADPH oxidoreductase
MGGWRRGQMHVMTTLGVIGSGHIGSTVAKLAVDAGHDVVLSNSRGPATLAELVAELGPRARGATGEDAAAAGDLVLVSLPLRAYASLPALALAGKTVLDSGNYYPERDGHIPMLGNTGLDDRTLTDSEYLARHLPGADVVKVFNNIFYKHLLNLARPATAADRSALPIAGDSELAKASVTAFLDSLGYDAVDGGPLAGSWRQQSGTPVYGTPYGPYDNETGVPADAAVIRAALAAAGG